MWTSSRASQQFVNRSSGRPRAAENGDKRYASILQLSAALGALPQVAESAGFVPVQRMNAPDLVLTLG
jgi:hypothetical protein